VTGTARVNRDTGRLVSFSDVFAITITLQLLDPRLKGPDWSRRTRAHDRSLGVADSAAWAARPLSITPVGWLTFTPRPDLLLGVCLIQKGAL
jgi:hypothetical protein